MREPTQSFRQDSEISEGLSPFTGNDPATFRAMIGSCSRLVLMGVGDAVIAVAAQVAGTYVGGMVDGGSAGPAPTSWRDDAVVTAVASTVAFLVVYRGYRDLHRSYVELGRDVFTATLWSVLLTAAVAQSHRAGRPLLAAASPIAGVITACLVVLWRIPFSLWAQKAWRERPLALVSTQPEDWQWRLSPYVAVQRSMTPQAFLQTPPAARGVLITPDVQLDDRERIVAWAVRNQLQLYLVPDTYEILVASGRPTQLNDIPLLEVQPLVLPAHLRVIKRVIDLLGAIVLFLVFVPVFLVVPLLIWLEDRGPVLYRQRRVGRDGTVFDLIKFRTMVPDAESGTGPVWAGEKDPRVTRIGRLLRSMRLDELPQIVNVLRGQMSLVGPRPERPELVRQFAAQNPMYRLREAVKPGITGLAQLLGRYDTDPDCKLRLDLSYMSRWKPGLDIIILLWTVPVVLLPIVRANSTGVLSAGPEKVSHILNSRHWQLDQDNGKG